MGHTIMEARPGVIPTMGLGINFHLAEVVSEVNTTFTSPPDGTTIHIDTRASHRLTHIDVAGLGIEIFLGA